MTDLEGHPDRERWNARYAAEPPRFEPHPLVAAAFAAGLPDGPVLELACGRSGSALELAAAGRRVTAVDVSDLALRQLGDEACRRHLDDRIERVLADVPSYDPGPGRYAFVLATRYWDAAAFDVACAAVAPGGLLGWEALRCEPGDDRDCGPWRVRHGELSARLPARFTVLDETATPRSTRLLARAAQ
ncbi:MAG: class I SAM-dependent methyltransferase [Actinomycetota bacterium]